MGARSPSATRSGRRAPATCSRSGRSCASAKPGTACSASVSARARASRWCSRTLRTEGGGCCPSSPGRATSPPTTANRCRRPPGSQLTAEIAGVRALSNVDRVTAPPSSTLPAVVDGDHVTGSDAPGLTLVEYGDFGCPFCFAASVPLKALLKRFDALRLVWRHLPDPELHPGADIAAELSELAAVHGKFWEAHSLLLAGRERFSQEDLLSVARRLELDEEETEAALRE